MTSFPGAFGQFAFGQGSEGTTTSSVATTLAFSTTAVALTLHDVTLSGAASRTLSVDHAAVTLTFNPITIVGGPHIQVAPTSVALGFGAVVFASIVQHRYLAPAPLPVVITMGSVSYTETQHAPPSSYYDPGAPGQFTLGQGDSGSLTAPLSMSLTISLNPVALLKNGVKLGTAVLSVTKMQVTLSFGAVTFAILHPITMRVPTAVVVITPGAVVLRSTHTYLSIDPATVMITPGRMDTVVPYQLFASDTLTVHEGASTAIGMVVHDAIMLLGAAIPRQQFDGVVADTLSMPDAATAIARFAQVQIDQLTIADSPHQVYAMTVNEAVNLGSAADTLMGLLVLERVAATTALDVSAIYNLSVAQQLRLLASLGNFIAGDLVDIVTLSGMTTSQLVGFATLLDTLTVTGAFDAYLVVQITAADAVNLTGTQLLEMIYDGEINASIDISVTYVGPNVPPTAWAINTRNNHITEYRQWAFNSFGKLNRVYIAASADGIYELVGDDDDGVPITTATRGGFFQPGGARYTAFKAAYIGMATPTGTTGVFLKLIAGDGSEYTYRVNPLDRLTSRVQFGKGLRSRYFAFELITSGIDFDLDTIEFIPLVSQRRFS